MARRKKTVVRRGNPTVKNVAGLMVGGASGALVGGLLVRAGVAPTPAALGVTAVGAVGTFTTTGVTKWAAGGMAASGVGQVALTWLAGQTRNADVQALEGARQAALENPDLARRQMLSALEDARNALSIQFDDDEDLVVDDGDVAIAV